MKVLLLDHRDSFAFLLAEQFTRRGAELATCRADVAPERFAARVADFAPDLVVLSPGPGRPEEFPATLPWLRSTPEVALFGVCLGMQAIGLACGARVVPAPRPLHGRASRIRLTDDSLVAGLPRTFTAGRYHSLVVADPPASLIPLAFTDDADHLLMAMWHKTRPWLGVQFHPESFLTPQGGVWIDAAMKLQTRSSNARPDPEVPLRR